MIGNTKHVSLYKNRNLWSGIMFGVGLVAFLDEAVFHQLLHWHHFYDKSTTTFGLVSDGIFHAFSWFATVGALYMVADLRRRKAFIFKRWLGSVLLGAGVFNFYDGTVQHKLMRLHQIRYNVDILPYDMAWNIIAICLIMIGIALLVQCGREFNQAGVKQKNALE